MRVGMRAGMRRSMGRRTGRLGGMPVPAVVALVVAAALGPAPVRAGASVPVPAAAASGPSLMVTPATDLDPAGAVIRVTGTGYDSAKALFGSHRGIYVAFGALTLGPDGRPTDPSWYTDASGYQAAVYVHRRPPGSVDSPTQKTMEVDPSNPDGATNGRFDFELTRADGSPITARWTAGDRTYDCTDPATRCYVLSFAAKGDTDRSQDVFIPVRFTGGPGPGPDPDPAATVTQTVTATVLGGALTLTATGDGVTLPPVGLRDVDQTTSAPLGDLIVGDYRETSPGWTLTGQVTDFRHGEDRIVADNLGWTPAARAAPSSLVAAGGDDVVAGPPAPPGQGLGSPRVLCGAPAGRGNGSWVCSALLTLGVPGSTRPGTYVATLTLTLA